MSLQDILMQRAALHFQNELGPTSGGTPSDLYQKIGATLEKRRQDKLAQEKQKEAFELLTSGGGIGGNSDSDRIGNLEKSGSYDPITGEVKVSYKTPARETDAQRATRIKTEIEIQKEKNIQSNTDRFITGDITGDEFLRTPGLTEDQAEFAEKICIP